MAEPKEPGPLLDQILRTARASAARAGTARVLERILGAMAQHCRIASERGGRLAIDVDSAAVFAELQGFRREEIRQAINAALQGRKFAELTFRLQTI